ncbi:hypothetical protein CPT_Madawaska_102 [Staphylococcus phage Madawaska]|nr:hypothetical protein CPT_Madawaska_102 [Staphylococcus phage Madawaska]
MLKKTTENELEKLFNVTIYNKEFSNLKPMYNRKDTETRTKLNDNQNSRVYENLINFINYSKAGMTHMFLTRSNKYKGKYIDFLKNRLGKEDLLYKNEYDYTDRFFRSFIYNIDIISRSEYQTHQSIENDSKLEDSFLLRNGNSSIDSFKTDNGLSIEFLDKDVKKDFLDKNKQISLESLLAIDTMVSNSLRKKWIKSIEREELPDMNIIFKEVPEVVIILANSIYDGSGFRLSHIDRSVININEDVSDVLKPILTLTSNINYKLILDLMNKDHLDEKSKHLKNNEFCLFDDDDIDAAFTIIGNIKRQTDHINNFIEEGKSDNLEDNINLIIKENENEVDDNFGEIIKVYIDRVLSKFREYVKDDTDILKNSSKILIGEDLFDFLMKLDDLEILMVRNIYRVLDNNLYNPVIRDVRESKEEVMNEITDYFKNNTKKLYLDLSNIDISKLKDSSFALLNDFITNGEVNNLRMKPNEFNMEYFYQLSMGKELNRDILNSNIQYMKQELLENFNVESKTTSNAIIEFDSFNINFAVIENNSYNNEVEIMMQGVTFKKKLTDEDIATIFLYSHKEVSIYHDKKLVIMDRNYYSRRGINKFINNMNNIFTDLDGESLSKYMSLIYDLLSLSDNSLEENKEIYNTLYYNKFEYINEENELKIDSYINIINNKDITSDFKKKFKKVRSKYLVSRIFI